MADGLPPTTNVDLEIFLGKQKLRKSYLKYGGLALCFGIVFLSAFAFWKGTIHSNPLWFIGLLVVFMAALAATASVFAGLRLANAEEAFGLPTGSVRSLLAIGIMVLFVVFGLEAMSDFAKEGAEPRLSEKPFQQLSIPLARLDDELKRYPAPEFLIVITDHGSAEAGKVSDAKVSLYTRETRRSQDAVDLEKQLITALVTLLTTVIGFYFGSRSVSDGLRHSSESTTVGSGMVADIAAELTKLKSDYKSLTDPLGKPESDLNVAMSRPGPSDPAKAEALKTASDRAKASLQAIKAARQSVDKSIDQADKGLKSLGGATNADVQKVTEAAVREAMKSINAGLDALRTASAGFAQQVSDVVAASAEG